MTKETNHEIMNALMEIGIPANLRGFPYIVYAEQLIFADQNYMHGITKALYIDIAKHFMTTPSNVERCIRTAIVIGWKVAKPETKEKIFHNTIRQGKEFPTNAHFITMLYYYITDLQ